MDVSTQRYVEADFYIIVEDDISSVIQLPDFFLPALVLNIAVVSDPYAQFN